jgi:hypothetical protein
MSSWQQAIWLLAILFRKKQLPACGLPGSAEQKAAAAIRSQYHTIKLAIMQTATLRTHLDTAEGAWRVCY